MLRSSPLTALLALALLASPRALDAQATSVVRPPVPTTTGAGFAERYAAIVASRGRIAEPERLRRLMALDWERTMVESPDYPTFLR